MGEQTWSLAEWTLAEQVWTLAEQAVLAQEAPKLMGGRRTSTSQADWWQHLLQDSSVAEALLLREQVLAVDVDMLESWDFDVFFYTREQLIAHLCVMAMRLGFTQLEVRASPSFGDRWQAVQEPSLELLASSPLWCSTRH